MTAGRFCTLLLVVMLLAVLPLLPSTPPALAAPATVHCAMGIAFSPSASYSLVPDRFLAQQAQLLSTYGRELSLMPDRFLVQQASVTSEHRSALTLLPDRWLAQEEIVCATLVLRGASVMQGGAR